MDNIKRCFTINQNRTTEEFKTYEELIKNNVFQAIEIFYPYDKTEEQLETYKQNVLNLMKYDIEVVLHLPHGFRSDLLNFEEYEVILQRFKDAIDFAKQFNVNKLTLHLGNSITAIEDDAFINSALYSITLENVRCNKWK